MKINSKLTKYWRIKLKRKTNKKIQTRMKLEGKKAKKKRERRNAHMTPRLFLCFKSVFEKK
jgi:hypothetical protein